MLDESVVNKQIAPADGMLMGARDREHYFDCGRSALACIQTALVTASISPSRIMRILDLPCGHGRVLRYLKAAFPEAEITACDLLRDGVDFCSSTFGAKALYSCDEPEAIPLERGSCDLIWVGSLFTHLDAPLWSRLLTVLRDSLAPGGLLVFSTHGRHTYQRVLEGVWDRNISYRRRTMMLYRYERTGFGYAQYLGSEGYYGLSLSHPAWVTRQLTALGGLRVVNVSETSWDDSHDVFATVRVPDSPGDVRRTSARKYLRHIALERMNPSLRSGLERIWRMGQR